MQLLQADVRADESEAPEQLRRSIVKAGSNHELSQALTALGQTAEDAPCQPVPAISTRTAPTVCRKSSRLGWERRGCRARSLGGRLEALSPRLPVHPTKVAVAGPGKSESELLWGFMSGGETDPYPQPGVCRRPATSLNTEGTEPEAAPLICATTPTLLVAMPRSESESARGRHCSRGHLADRLCILF